MYRYIKYVNIYLYLSICISAYGCDMPSLALSLTVTGDSAHHEYTIGLLLGLLTCDTTKNIFKGEMYRAWLYLLGPENQIKPFQTTLESFFLKKIKFSNVPNLSSLLLSTKLLHFAA